MKNLPIYFMSGLPRSGSTLFLNLLAQDKNNHVTPTNDLIELVVTTRNIWMNQQGFISQGLDVVQPRVENAIAGMIQGFYKDEFADGKRVVDKSRGWVAYIELLEQILGQNCQMIVTIRDVRSIVASFEQIYRKSSMTFPTPTQDQFFNMQTVDGRARSILSPGGVVGRSINIVRDVFSRGLQDRLSLIPYDAFCKEPQHVMNQLHNRLGWKQFDYNPDDVKQTTYESDLIYGMKLHGIRNKIVPNTTSESYVDVLPSETCEWIAAEYHDINTLANNTA